MRFVSKTNNLCIILRPGLQAQPLTGTPAVPTIYVRFHDGIADVLDEKLQQMMFNHPGFQRDFFKIEESDLDPYKNTRQSSEPSHILTEMNYGHPGKRIESNKPSNIPPAMMKAMQEMAVSMAKEMAPTMAAEMVNTVLPGLVEKKLAEALSSQPNTIESQDEEQMDVEVDETTGEAEMVISPKKGGRPKKIV